MNNVLAFIKTHTLALVCGIVALIAIGVLLFIIPGKFDELNATVQQETVAPYTAITQLRDESRTLPVTTIGAKDPVPLEGFPTPRVIEQGNEAIKKLGDQAKESLAQLTRLNERKLLVPNSLPDASTLARQSFYNTYRDLTQQAGTSAQNGIVRTILQGMLPPSAEEIRIIGDQRANQILNSQAQRDLTTGQITNQQQVEAAIAEMRARLPMEQRIGRARNSKVYVSPDAVAVHPLVNAPVGALDPPTIFNAQVSLWLQQTAFEAIADANSAAKDVFDAPVKHLVKLDVPMEVAPIGSRSGGPVGFGSQPADPSEGGAAPVTADATVALTPTYTRSPYGYAHNSLYDAFPVTMVLRVDVRQLPQILSTLGRGRLLKINNVNLSTVDAGRALAEQYIYDENGKTPLVEVRLDCDVLLLRTWLVPLMPTEVKAYFGSLSNPQPTM